MIDDARLKTEQANQAITLDIWRSASKILQTVTGITQDSINVEVENIGHEYAAQVKAAESAKKRFDDLKTGYVNASNDFKKAFEDWKLQKKKEKGFDDAMMVIGLVIDIGMIAYSGGTAAAKSGGNIAKTVLGKKEKSKDSQPKDSLKRMEELCSRLEKVQSAVGTAQDWGKKFMASKEPEKGATRDKLKEWAENMAKEMSKTDEETDWGEIKAMWDDFEIDSEEAFKNDINKLDIDKTSDYYTAMKKFVARGRDLFAAQRDAQVLRKKLRQIKAYRELFENKKKDYVLSEPTKNVIGTPIKLAKVLIEAEMASTKRWLFLALHNWVLATAYLNAMEKLPNIRMPQIDGSLAEVIRVIDKIQTELLRNKIGSWQQADDDEKIPPVRISTKDNDVFQEDWKNSLKTTHQINFSVPPTKATEPLSYIKRAS
jgi:hypothetical protein